MKLTIANIKEIKEHVINTLDNLKGDLNQIERGREELTKPVEEQDSYYVDKTMDKETKESYTHVGFHIGWSYVSVYKYTDTQVKDIQDCFHIEPIEVLLKKNEYDLTQWYMSVISKLKEKILREFKTELDNV